MFYITNSQKENILFGLLHSRLAYSQIGNIRGMKLIKNWNQMYCGFKGTNLSSPLTFKPREDIKEQDFLFYVHLLIWTQQSC